MQLLLAVLLVIVIGSLVAAVVYVMLIVGWIIALSTLALLFVSAIYAMIKNWCNKKAPK